MRTKRSLIVVALGLFASTAFAQPPNTPPAEPGENTGLSTLVNPGQIDFGIRGTAYGSNSDEARYQRFRDLRNGPFLDAFRFGNATDQRFFDVRAEHVGYRDQRYVANYNHYGKVKASFEWNQIPLFFSRDTATLYSSPSPGVFQLPQGLQKCTTVRSPFVNSLTSEPVSCTSPAISCPRVTGVFRGNRPLLR